MVCFDYGIFIDGLTGEFDRAVGSMLSVRGEGILAWLGDDSFVVGGDQKAANPEVIFSRVFFRCESTDCRRIGNPMLSESNTNIGFNAGVVSLLEFARSCGEARKNRLITEAFHGIRSLATRTGNVSCF